jgi:hypothetical protein
MVIAQIIKKVTALKVQSQFVLGLFTCAIIILVALNLYNNFHEKTFNMPGMVCPNGVSHTDTVRMEINIDPGNLDKLLEMADKDVGGLSKVKVAIRSNRSASLDMPEITAAWGVKT